MERAKWSSWLSDSMHIRMRSGHNGRSKFWSVLLLSLSFSLSRLAVVRGIAFKIEITVAPFSPRTPRTFIQRTVSASVRSWSSNSSFSLPLFFIFLHISSLLYIFVPFFLFFFRSIPHHHHRHHPSVDPLHRVSSRSLVRDHTVSHEFSSVRSVWRSSSTNFHHPIWFVHSSIPIIVQDQSLSSISSWSPKWSISISKNTREIYYCYIASLIVIWQSCWFSTAKWKSRSETYWCIIPFAREVRVIIQVRINRPICYSTFFLSGNAKNKLLSIWKKKYAKVKTTERRKNSPHTSEYL